MKIWKRIAAVLLVVLYAALSAAPVAGTCVGISAKRNVKDGDALKVAVISLDGFYKKNSEGQESGYGVDYFRELSQYTGFRFKFVQFPDEDACFQALRDGRADIAAPVDAVLEAQEGYREFSYTRQGIIYSYMSIFTMDERDDLYYNDIAQIQGLRIGVTEERKDNGALQEFWEEAGIVPQLEVYPEIGACKRALKNGEIDAIVTDSMNYEPEFKPLLRFSGGEAGLAAKKGREALLEQLDHAIITFKTDNPHSEIEMYTEYYPESDQVPFTREEIEYIRKTDHLNVGLSTERIPISWYNKNSRQFEGIAADMLKMLEEQIGIKINLVPIEAGVTPADMLAQEDVDLILPAASRTYYPESSKIVVSEEIFDVKIVIASAQGKGLKKSDELLIGMPKGYDGIRAVLSQKKPYFKIKEYEDDFACLKALEAGEVDAIAQSSYAMGHLMKSPRYDSVSVIPSMSVHLPFCIAASTEQDPRMMMVINKGIKHLDQNELDAVVNNYTIFKPYEYTIGEYFYKYRRTYLTGLLISLLILCVLWVHGRQKIKFYKALEEKNSELEKASQAKGEFLSRMSHEMRTPMNAIIGIAGLAQRAEGVPQDVQLYISKIRNSGEYLLSLINDILDMSKIESKKIELNIQPSMPGEIFENVISIIRPAAAVKNIDFTFEAEGITEKYAMLDKMRIQQIFLNLLSNAVKFTPDGGKIECLISNISRGGNKVKDRIIIRDNGIGMSEEFMAKLFLPFEQEHSGRTTNYQGTGLGLAIVKNLVELMGGTITVRSELGKGTEFTVELEIEIADETQAMHEEEKTEQAFNFQGKRVLLVEDHPLNTELAVLLLEEVHVEVTTAENGKAALDKLLAAKSASFDAVLMDIRMPVMDGLHATREIRQIEKQTGEHIPIIAMTANAFDEDARQCMEAGMDAHLGKPIKPELLYQTLARFFSK